jgi:RNA polymerase sigma-70 factor (ECF subfamily)
MEPPVSEQAEASGNGGAVSEVVDARDARILFQVASGNIAALGELFDAHHRTVRDFLIRAIGDASVADDLTQATFLEVAKAAASFEGHGSCRTWLIGIAVHMLQRHRQASVRLRRIVTKMSEVVAPPEMDPERIVVARDQLNRVEKAFYEMSEAKRVALLLAEGENLNCEEIAALLDVPVGTVWTRLYHARRELSAAIDRSAPAGLPRAQRAPERRASD